jgi:predicted nucleic acid-binding protein
MHHPLSDLPTIPPDLLFDAEVPSTALFFDTNSALQVEVRRAQKQGHLTLISSLVYGELISRRKGPKELRAIELSLVERDLRVVPFDAHSARCFFDLNRHLLFDTAPLLRQQENERQCRDRLRFDVAIFAAALRHRAILITDNTRDFQHFPFKSYWKTRAEAFP